MKICIIKSTAIVIVLLGVSLVANGGIWESTSAKVFRLDVNSIKSYNITDADDFWIQSLLKNLASKGGRVAKYHVFIRTNGLFRVSDRKNPGIVYINRNNPDEFITSDPVFLVDFKKGKVDMFVFGAQSLHPDPDKKFIVIVDSLGGNLDGIPVSSSGVKPNFSGRVVTWY